MNAGPLRPPPPENRAEGLDALLEILADPFFDDEPERRDPKPPEPREVSADA